MVTIVWKHLPTSALHFSSQRLKEQLRFLMTLDHAMSDARLLAQVSIRPLLPTYAGKSTRDRYELAASKRAKLMGPTKERKHYVIMPPKGIHFDVTFEYIIQALIRPYSGETIIRRFNLVPVQMKQLPIT